ncbi:restriction endonuclease subunit S [Klebsiella pneumoniae]
MSICTEETKIAVIGRYKNFDDYISSGYDYLPKVPTHWRVLRNRQLFQFKKRIVGKFVEKYQVLSLTLNGVIPRDIESGKGKMPAEFDSYQIVKPRNLIFCLFDIDETPRTIGISSHEGMVTGAYKVAEVVKEHSPEFVYYYYLHLDEFKGLKPFYTGLRKVVRPETFLGLCIPVPPLEEQRTIAAFLDFETARIDKLIAQQQRLIELLKEKRQAVISHAVTKGLNPDAPMKDSGVEWLGEVPEHWRVCRLKHVKSSQANSFVDGPFGSNLKSEHFVENGDVYVIESNFATTGELVPLDLKTVTNEHFKTIQRSSTVGGDIIIAKIGARFGSSAILPELDKAAVVSGNSLKLTVNPSIIDVEYANHVFQHLKREGAVDDGANITAQPALSLGTLNNLCFVVPPLKEQHIILLKIKNETKIYDGLLDKAGQFIKLIQERRTALISAAVTGKIDLRGWTASTEEVSNG